MTLTDAEVRERFSAYHEGELPPAEAAFVRKRLEQDKALAAEYAAFRRLLGGLASLSLDAAEETRTAEQAPVEQVDLLAGVQKRLNKRSGGRFYRTRWSRAAGLLPLEAIAAVVLALLLMAYLGMTYISELRSADAPAGPPPRPPPAAPGP